MVFRDKEGNFILERVVMVCIFAVILFIAVCMAIFPIYKVWQQRLEGQAMLAHAQSISCGLLLVKKPWLWNVV